MEDEEVQEAPEQDAPEVAAPTAPTFDVERLAEQVAQTNQAVQTLSSSLAEAAKPRKQEVDYWSDEAISQAQEEGRLGAHMRAGLAAFEEDIYQRRVAPLEQHGMGSMEKLARRERLRAADKDDDLEKEVDRRIAMLAPHQRGDVDAHEQIRSLVYGSTEGRRRFEQRLRAQWEAEEREKGNLRMQGVSPPPDQNRPADPTPDDLFSAGVIGPKARRELNTLRRRGELDEWCRQSTAATGLGVRDFRGWAQLHGWSPED